MGFRDFMLFNQAMLARQASRLLIKPNFLCPAVKAKYFPNGNLLDTVFSNDASASWKCVEHGLELLKRGLFG
jgi:hypothetical protein